MRKKITAPSPRRAWSSLVKNPKYKVIACVCVTIVLTIGAVAGPWSNSLGVRRMSSLFYSPPPPPPLPSPANPSKEYIYAGGRLIATEEPNPLVAPLNLLANTVSSAQINISWNAAPNAHHYVVERASQLGNFTTLNSNVTGTSFTDSTVTNLSAYLYRVKSADAGGNVSPSSNIDVATAITFDDDPFASPPTLTLVKAQHVLQLRQAVNAVRHTTPTLGDYSWTQASATLAGAPIKAVDVEELRTALDQALSILGLPVGGYTDSSLTGLPISKLYITELRARVK